jgi:oxygen-independent coproporphyrinogen-3 oxidase
MAKKPAMVSALQKELELRKDEFKDEVVETIYFGGGTPSVLEIEEIKALIETVYANYKVLEHAELTLEANPDDLSKDQIIQLSDSQINRLSIGVQSFFDEDLKLMNRAHSFKQATESLAFATQHFDNISLDLIYGIPGMDNERWLQNIDKALSFDIPHISSYALTVEPKTALAHMIKVGSIQDVNDEQAREQFYILVDALEKNGFINYELSNFGKQGYFSKNNTAYWKGKKYIGIGPSAHSFDGSRRAWNVRNNSKYIKAISIGQFPIETEILSVADKYNEYIMTGLRTIWGVSIDKIASDYGQEYRNYLIEQSQKHIDDHLLTLGDATLKVTRKGKFLVDGIAADLFMVNKDRSSASAFT